MVRVVSLIERNVVSKDFLNIKYEKLRTMSRDELQEIINVSTSISECLSNLGIRSARHQARYILQTRISIEKLNTSSFEIKKSNVVKSNEDLFVENSNTLTCTIKKRIMKHKLLEYKCFECGNTGEYNNKPLTLQLDHINGNHTDNRLENLRFLCPNCHSQTETSCGRNKPSKVINYCSCGKEIYSSSSQCHKCASVDSGIISRRFEVTKEELQSLIETKPFTHIGKMFGVSDNAVKKRCIKLGIEIPSRLGYWTKVKHNKV